jgi:hypothetical protein
VLTGRNGCDERSEHFPQRWPDEVEEAFWDCGICSQVPKSWDEWIGHIGDHYKDESDMAAWGPRVTPASLHRDYMTPLREYKPVWDAAALLVMQ